MSDVSHFPRTPIARPGVDLARQLCNGASGDGANVIILPVVRVETYADAAPAGDAGAFADFDRAVVAAIVKASVLTAGTPSFEEQRQAVEASIGIAAVLLRRLPLSHAQQIEFFHRLDAAIGTLARLAFEAGR